MGLWAIYFLAAVTLHYRGHVRFAFVPNLIFALALMVPLPGKLAARPVFRGTRTAAAAAAALLLLWHESWLPPLLRTVRLLSETGGLSPAYLLRFLEGTIVGLDLAILAALLVVCLVLARRIVLAPLALAAIVSVPIVEARFGAGSGAAQLARFLDEESRRVVRFGDRPAGAPDFDVVLLHICSLSWSDLGAAGLEQDGFLRQFDLVFTRFNSVSSYTNPSAIRLLRASCGQQSHADLYGEAKKECYLLDALRARGYETSTAIDNYAPTYRFVEDIVSFGHADPPLEMRDLPVRQYDFDRSPIYDDLAILERWWKGRDRPAVRRAALYMDITTLHGGAHWSHEERWWARGRSVLYREFGERLFANLGTFFETLRTSGRNVVVLFVPEHGMALRGSALQPPDIREIPLPTITTVPVGVKLIGPGLPARPERQETVAKPTSYLALAYLLRAFLEAPRFGRDAMLTGEVLGAIPETRFVAENEAVVVMKDGDALLLRKDRNWTRLPNPESPAEADVRNSSRTRF